jgi:hypothetical protein
VPRLYSYCIPVDDGAAPNPYWGTCTLVICKPAIRRTARVGDWIAGTGSKAAKVDQRTTQDLSGRLVYAMLVTKKLTMAEYDSFTRANLPEKVPSDHADRRRRLGDSLYDFSKMPIVQRPGVHGPANQKIDLAGGFALLSTDFYYFGADAIELPKELLPLAQNRQGHRVTLNEPYVELFTTWIRNSAGGVRGEPLLDLLSDDSTGGWCAGCRAEEDGHDAEVFDEPCP